MVYGAKIKRTEAGIAIDEVNGRPLADVYGFENMEAMIDAVRNLKESGSKYKLLCVSRRGVDTWFGTGWACDGDADRIDYTIGYSVPGYDERVNQPNVINRTRLTSKELDALLVRFRREGVQSLGLIYKIMRAKRRGGSLTGWCIHGGPTIVQVRDRMQHLTVITEDGWSTLDVLHECAPILADKTERPADWIKEWRIEC